MGKYRKQSTGVRTAAIFGGASVVAALGAAAIANLSVSTADAAVNPAADSSDDQTASASASASVQVVPGYLTMSKTSNRSKILPGQPVIWTIKVGAVGVQFKNVKVTDPTCAPLVGPTGPNVNDGILEPDNTWTYTCTQSLNTTTTNTASVTGVAVFDGGGTGTPSTTPTPTTTATPTQTPTPTPTSTGPVYVDGTYTGLAANITVPEVPNEVYTDTVTVIISGGKVSNVTAKLGTIPNRTSTIIAQDCNTQMIAEAIANNGQVTSVSGATYTAIGFKASLQDALTKATAPAA